MEVSHNGGIPFTLKLYQCILIYYTPVFDGMYYGIASSICLSVRAL